MAEQQKHARLPGKLVFVGFGSVGQGVLPLLLRHLDIRDDGILIVTADDTGAAEAARFGVPYRVEALTPQNWRGILDQIIAPGDFLLNVSVDVSSIDLIEYCMTHGAMYLDTCIEPWIGGYTDASLPAAHRTNYALRERARALNAKHGKGPTAILTHGANPGLVSHFVKQALLNIARDDTRLNAATPRSRAEWAALAERIGMKVVHIAERDTQYAIPQKRPGEFVNTWSVEGFVGEGSQPSELGWGSHEKHFPHDGVKYDFGPRCSIFLNRPGVSMRVRSWTPLEGRYYGFLITHGESISIADYYSVRDQNGDVRFRPTVHYAYHPCDGAVLSVHEYCGKAYRMQERKRVLMDDIQGGMDELGVLLMGHRRGAYWFGSQLKVEEARALAPYNNATSLQVGAGILGAIVWACEHPGEGVVDPDEMDFQRVLEVARPYLGNLVGVYSDWTPLADRGVLFPEDVDLTDPWQFKNFRVV